MKRVLFFIVAVLMILPMIVSCGEEKKEGKLVDVPNVKVLSLYSADAEGNVAAQASEIYKGTVTAYVEADATLILKDVVDAYARDINTDAYYDEDNRMYTKFAGLSAGSDWFWNYIVNGEEVGLDFEVKVGDSIEIIFQKISDETVDEK